MAAQAVLDLAKRICRLLKDREEISRFVEGDLTAAVNRPFPVPTGPTATTLLLQYDAQGCEVWNAATNMLRERDPIHGRHTSIDPKSRLMALLRVFAFLLVDTARRCSKQHPGNSGKHIRPLKIGLKACACCLGNGESELALKVLERCSEHVSAIEQDTAVVQISATEVQGEQRKIILESLVQEFHLLRIGHAWRSDRLDLADHFYQTLSLPRFATTTTLADKAADLFHEIAKTLVKKKLDESAIKWLDRAMVILDQGCDVPNDPDIAELRLNVTSTLVECLLRGTQSSSFQRAQSLIDDLCKASGLGDRLAVHIMQIKTHLSEDPLPLEIMRSLLSRMIRSGINDDTFKPIMQCMHWIQKVDVPLVYDALTELLDFRLLSDRARPASVSLGDQLRIEQAVITHTFFAMNDATEGERACNALQRALDMVASRNNNTFSPKATHTAQTLIWKAAGSVAQELAEKWCELLGHRLFDGAGQANKNKIARKAMSMALEADNITMARTFFFRMPTPSQNESETRYLAFKLALRSNDYHLATESLRQVAKQAKGDPEFLYACVLAAQRSEMRTIAVTALQAVIDHGVASTHLSTLLRCTAKLMIGELRSVDNMNVGRIMNELAHLFESAVNSISTSMETTSDEQRRNEIQWWSKNAYNLCLEYMDRIIPEHAVRLLEACVLFISAYPDVERAVQEDGLMKRKAHSHYLCAAGYATLARLRDDGSEDWIRDYLQVRKHVTGFESVYGHMVGEARHQFSEEAFELLKLDLESILRLKQWDQLDVALQECLNWQTVDRWDTLAGLIVIIREQSGIAEGQPDTAAKMNQVMDKIINETWQRDKDITKASRWLRLSFSMDLESGNGVFALELLKQAANMAKMGYGKESGTYPERELQWLAITSFNKAVDLLSASVLNGTKDWFDGALELARYAGDNGALHTNLTKGYGQAMERLQQVLSRLGNDLERSMQE